MPAWRYGGPIRSVHNLCKELVCLGHEVHVYTTNVDGNDRLDVRLGVPINIDGVLVTYFPVTSSLSRFYFSLQLWKALRRDIKKFDFLHLHSIFLWPSFIGARLACLTNTAYCISLRGMLVKQLFKRKSYIAKNIWLYLVGIRSIKHADFIHVTSSLELAEAQRFNINIRRYEIIPNGISDFNDGDKSEVNYKYSNNNLHQINFQKLTPYILFVGRINWKKGLDRLIESLIYVDPNINLVIVGNDEEGYQAFLNSLVIKLSLSSRVFFLGEARGGVKFDLYREAKLLVLPSYSENFGNVLLEALFVGCPVATTKDVGLHNELVENRVAISLPDNIVLMAACLNKVISNETLLKKMGQDGMNLVRHDFSWHQVAQKMQRAYKNSFQFRVL